MIFYHFTTGTGAKGVVSKGEIFLGKVPAFEKGKKTRPAVSLTTSNQPAGHGLPDGRKVSEEEFQHLLKNAPDNFALVRDPNGGYLSADHTEVRLEIDIPESLFAEYGIQRAIDQYDPIQLLAMDVTGYFPLGHYSDSEMAQTMKAFQTGALERKSPTWWSAEKAIPLSMIKTAAIKFQDQYYVTPAEEFIAEARAALAEEQGSTGSQ